MRAILLPTILLSAVSLLHAEDLPKEAATAKETFEKNVASFSTEPLESLNEKYAASLEAAKKRAQDSGNLGEVLALAREFESIVKNGRPSSEADAEGGEFEKLRGIYVSERAKIDEHRQTAFQAALAEYTQTLSALVKDFTKAGRIDDAVATQGALDAASSIALVNPPIARAEEKSIASVSAEPRAGRLRGFGRTTLFKPAGAEFDFSKFEKYDDFVDIAGGQRDFLLLRENGDVLNERGETVGTNAESIIATGFIDRKGRYHTTAGLRFTESAQPLVSLDYTLEHGLALRNDGTLHGWKDEYETGKRKIPNVAKSDIVQIGCRRHDDWALNSKGDLFRWNIDGEAEVPSSIESGVARLATSNFHSAFVLTENNEVFDLEGNRPSSWRKDAKDVLSGGIMWAVLDMDDRWHAFVLEGNQPVANELEVLNAVLNRSETIDVAFHTYPGKDLYLSNYVLWIEDPNAPEFDFKDPKALKDAAESQRQPGVGFFGNPIE